MSALLKKNKELSGKIISLTAKIASLENEAEKKAENIVLSAPEPRPTLQKTNKPLQILNQRINRKIRGFLLS